MPGLAPQSPVHKKSRIPGASAPSVHIHSHPLTAAAPACSQSQHFPASWLWLPARQQQQTQLSVWKSGFQVSASAGIPPEQPQKQPWTNLPLSCRHLGVGVGVFFYFKYLMCYLSLLIKMINVSFPYKTKCLDLVY